VVRTDVRAVLPSVRVPTLVVARDGFDAVSESRQVAEWIPGARLAVVPGGDRPLISDVQDRFLQELRAFVAEVRHQEAELDRVLATVLFTDIVNSTEQSAAMGDRRWQTVRADHDRIVRASVARYRGKALKTMGDGFLATFDGPARGVHCARAISLRVRSLGIEVRAGLLPARSNWRVTTSPGSRWSSGRGWRKRDRAAAGPAAGCHPLRTGAQRARRRGVGGGAFGPDLVEPFWLLVVPGAPVAWP
jgi:hypothetical protein